MRIASLLPLFLGISFALTLTTTPRSPNPDNFAALAKCERINYKDRLVYCFAQTHCYGWTLQKFLTEKEFKEHPHEDTAACVNTKIDIKSCWYPSEVHKDLGCKIFDLPNCRGKMLHVPASNTDARWFMRDFSWTKPSWSVRIKSMKCFKMNAAGQST